jgi:ketosteroid isomerase-like protein
MPDSSTENQIRTLVKNWARAVREGDMDGVLAHHTDDVVMFDVPPAFCHSLLRIGCEKKPQVRLTIGFRKTRGKWLIAHEPHSAPIESE